MKSSQTKLRMPAEWEPHASTWLAWPHYRGDWPGKFEPIPWVYAEIIRHLGRHERVDLIVHNATSEKQARKILSKANALSKNVRFHRWPTNRVWTRDSGCTFVLNRWPCGRGRPARAKRPSQDKLRPLCRHLALQRLGQILQLSARRKNRQPHGPSRSRLTQSVRSTANRGSCSKAGPSRSTDAAPC